MPRQPMSPTDFLDICLFCHFDTFRSEMWPDRVRAHSGGPGAELDSVKLTILVAFGGMPFSAHGGSSRGLRAARSSSPVLNSTGRISPSMAASVAIRLFSKVRVSLGFCLILCAGLALPLDGR